MFENEAEEYAGNREVCDLLDAISEDLQNYDYGTVAHYNIDPLVEECFKDGAEFGYNKANEWHYPSKGELPKCDDKTQLIFYVNCYYEIGGKTITRKRTVLGYYQNSFLNDDIKLFVEKSKGYENEHLPKDIIAWKEIVLPELPKESE